MKDLSISFLRVFSFCSYFCIAVASCRSWIMSTFLYNDISKEILEPLCTLSFASRIHQLHFRGFVLLTSMCQDKVDSYCDVRKACFPLPLVYDNPEIRDLDKEFLKLPSPLYQDNARPEKWQGEQKKKKYLGLGNVSEERPKSQKGRQSFFRKASLCLA